MKIRITLSEEEIAGIKDYLAMLDEKEPRDVTNREILTLVSGIVDAGINSGSLGDYILERTNK